MMIPRLQMTLHADRVAYLQDLAAIHFDWMATHLAKEQYQLAIEAHDRFRKVVDAIDGEMGQLRTLSDQVATIGAEAEAWRQDRGPAQVLRPKRQA